MREQEKGEKAESVEWEERREAGDFFWNYRI